MGHWLRPGSAELTDEDWLSNHRTTRSSSAPCPERAAAVTTRIGAETSPALVGREMSDRYTAEAEALTTRTVALILAGHQLARRHDRKCV